MLEPSPATTASSVHTTTAPASLDAHTSSPARPSRLRGLSYLRNYTHAHLHRSPNTSGTDIDDDEHNTTTTPSSPTAIDDDSAMTRSRIAAAFGPTTAANPSSARRSSTVDLPEIAAMPSAMPDTTSSSAPTSAGPTGRDALPTIRFIPHVENRSSRPSLHFSALSRQLKTLDAKVKVGRYSERDSSTGDVVGFKSKVVSRRHCEFWCTDGQWYVKDVKSSSGTFLNHVRLSPPGVESRPYAVNDGDVVQLGIDFKGGEEVIFRCVKIRIECNRGWQKSLNSFNTSAHKRLLQNSIKPTPAGKIRDSDTASVNSSECSICLNAVAPCQALFVAPCSHVWHYKCIRGLIHGPNYPNFLCPNCRMVADLEADVEQPEEEAFETLDDADLQVDAGGEASDRPDSARSQQHSDADERDPERSATGGTSQASQDGHVDEDLSRMLHDTAIHSPTPQVTTRADQSSSSALPPLNSQPIDIARSRSGHRSPSDSHGARSTTPTSHTQFALSVGPNPITEGPLTPRNDAGPFVFDGSAGRDRIDNNLISQAVAEVSEPGSPDEPVARNWPL